MKIIIIPLLFSFLLFGCQQKASSGDIHNEASDIYYAIKSKVNDNITLTDDDYKLIDHFKEQYIKNYNDYPNDEELISNMEGLINSYNYYNVAVGLKDNDGIDYYSKSLSESISKLNKEFNK